MGQGADSADEVTYGTLSVCAQNPHTLVLERSAFVCIIPSTRRQPQHPGADRMAQGAGEAPRVVADDPYVDN